MIIRLKLKKSTDMYFTYYSGYSTNKPVINLQPPDACFASELITSVTRISARKTKISPTRERSMEYDYFIVPLPIGTVIKTLNGEVNWQNEEYTFTEVERVYSTRIDCMAKPERVRQAA